MSRLLDEVLDLDAAGRLRRLAEIALAEPQLAQELRAALLAAERADAEGFLHGTMLTALPLPPPGLAGRRIGSYRIEAELGQGGTGSVWLARQLDGRESAPVAIKLLHLSLLGKSGAQRFAQEGVILARLAHPHIARLIDAGMTPEGQPYLVLEHIAGVPIDQYCDDHRLGIDGRLRLAGQVMAALAHAHAHGVVHRDIKPSNILVTRAGHVKLLDFGIAKWLDGPDHRRIPVTVEGHRVMTPRYAAPEQFLGLPVTAATDVYAVGVLLHELLCGRSATAAAVDTVEVIRQTVDLAPPRMAVALLRDADSAESIAAARGTTPAPLRRQLRGDLQHIVSKALRKRAVDRYASISACADDVQRYLQGQPVHARPKGLAGRLSRFLRACRANDALAMLACIALGAGIGGGLAGAIRVAGGAL